MSDDKGRITDEMVDAINNICSDEPEEIAEMINNELKELHWFCSDSGHREAIVCYDGKEYYVQMMEVERGGKGGVHDIYTTKEVRPMGNHSERYAEDCAENWVIGVI